jgi:hypothetical protein
MQYKNGNTFISLLLRFVMIYIRNIYLINDLSNVKKKFLKIDYIPVPKCHYFQLCKLMALEC